MNISSIITTKTGRRTTAFFIIVLGVISLVVFAGAQSKPAPSATTVSPALYQATTTHSLPITVSGVVRAADAAVIRAQTNGVVATVPAYEGMTAAAGDLLVKQATPVATAQLAQATANLHLTTTQQAAARSGKDTEATIKGLQADSAKTLATLRTNAAATGVQDAGRGLLIALKAAALQAVSTADFITNNSTRFTSEGRDQYRAVIYSLYNYEPNQFAAGVSTGDLHSADDVLQRIQELDQATSLDPVELFNLTHLLDANLAAMRTVLVTGEPQFLDSTNLDPQSALYSTYLKNRSGVLSAAQSLQTALTNARAQVTAQAETQTGQTTAVQVSDADAAEAAVQAHYAETIAHYATAAAAAGRDVAAAALSLASSRAPFTGTVTAVSVKAGNYVTAGTPLVTLVGDGAREVVLHVPTRYASYLVVGQPFVVDGQTVGSIDRFSQVANNGALQVVVTLTADAPAVGETVTGSLRTETGEGMIAIPHAYLHFGSTGPYVENTTGEKHPVQIFYDDTSRYYVASDSFFEAALIPAFSVNVTQ